MGSRVTPISLIGQDRDEWDGTERKRRHCCYFRTRILKENEGDGGLPETTMVTPGRTTPYGGEESLTFVV